MIIRSLRFKMVAIGKCSPIYRTSPEFDFPETSSRKLGLSKIPVCNYGGKSFGFSISGTEVKTSLVAPLRAIEASRTSQVSGKTEKFQRAGCDSNEELPTNDCNGFSGRRFFSLDLLPLSFLCTFSSLIIMLSRKYCYLEFKCSLFCSTLTLLC